MLDLAAFAASIVVRVYYVRLIGCLNYVFNSMLIGVATTWKVLSRSRPVKGFRPRRTVFTTTLFLPLLFINFNTNGLQDILRCILTSTP